MKSWLDLESRFRSLVPRLKYARLDAQWGAAGEYWQIAGSGDQVTQQEFELLCGVAGRFLEKVYSPKNEDESTILSISDPRHRWYTLLKRFAGVQSMIYGEQKSIDGSGFIYTGTVVSFVESSANLCLSLQASHPILDKPGKLQWFHDNYLKTILIGVVLAVIAALLKF